MRTAKRYWNLLIHYLKPQAARVALLGALILSHIGLQLISPQIVRHFIDTVSQGADAVLAGTLGGVVLAFLGVAVASQALSIAVTYLGQNVAWTATNALRLDLARHCLRLDMSFHKSRTPGELIERIDGDVTALGNFFSQMVIRLASNGLFALAILVVLWREDWRVSLAGAVYVLSTLLLMRAIQKPAVQAWAGERQAHAELMGFLGERLTGTEDIRANGGEPYVMARLYRLMRGLLKKARKARLMGNLPFIVGYSSFMLVAVFTLAIGATLFLQRLITIGTVYLLISYINRLYQPLAEIREQVADLQQAAASIERVEELFGTQPSLAEKSRFKLPRGALPVAFERVSFRYDDGPNGDGTDSVLDEVSFELASGAVLGLLGRTGSGKTTLTRLLFRLYDPTAGAIRLDGVDIRDVGLSDLRQRVGMVTQEVQLFGASVRDNLTLFNRGMPDEHILAALEKLGLGKWARSLPEGLDTPLEPGGKGLSAGEAQLLAFARVFLKDPGLVILDEASSRLDPATERLLERAIDRLLQGRSAIIIAHRLETVHGWGSSGRADEIMILEDGRVREHGDRQALAQDPRSRFYRLLQTGLEEALV